MSDAAALQRAAETKSILTDCRAILSEDHFVYISGQHGSGWIDKDAIFVNPARINCLAELLAAAVRSLEAEMLCGPATGGLVVAQWTAFSLNLPAVFTEHDAASAAEGIRGPFILRRGYDQLVAGRRVLVVDDVVNSGHSVRQTVRAVRRAGGEVQAAAALVDRGNIDAAGLEVAQYLYLLECDIPEWPGAECPLCRRGQPVNTRYAHGREFLARQINC